MLPTVVVAQNGRIRYQHMRIPLPYASLRVTRHTHAARLWLWASPWSGVGQGTACHNYWQLSVGFLDAASTCRIVGGGSSSPRPRSRDPARRQHAPTSLAPTHSARVSSTSAMSWNQSTQTHHCTGSARRHTCTQHRGSSHRGTLRES